MKDRFVQLLEREQISPSRFADLIGVQRSSVSHIISGRNNPSYDFLQKTLNAFPGLRAEWLLMGRGPMFERQDTGFTGTLFDAASSPPAGKTAGDPDHLRQGSSIRGAKGPGSPGKEFTGPDTKSREHMRAGTDAEPGISRTESAASVTKPAEPEDGSAPGTETGASGAPGTTVTDHGTSRRKVVQVLVLYDDRTFSVFDPSGPV